MFVMCASVCVAVCGCGSVCVAESLFLFAEVLPANLKLVILIYYQLCTTCQVVKTLMFFY